jgi:RimJ/RimL family protein N-acetyltransferase
LIETERLLLRPWREADRAPFAAIVADPQVSDWLGGERVRTDAYFDAMVAFWRERGHGTLAIVRRRNDALIGRIVLRRMPPEWEHPMEGEVEVGWMLARDSWGRGYASEAAMAALDWGFDALGVTDIFSWTVEHNHRSQAVMQRIGMVRAPERDFDQPGVPEGDPMRRHVVYVKHR